MEWGSVLDFYKGKRVLITGHTGFKGSWLSKVLIRAGATVFGYAIKPPTNPNLFSLCALDNDSSMHSMIGDIRDLHKLNQFFGETQPEIVLHLAAQPIVRDSYQDPVYTYETNVMGTVHVLECVRQCESVRSFLNVTTDKVYLNVEKEQGYREYELLDGYDPYSNSKSCSELVTHCYRRSFFGDGSGIDGNGRRLSVSTARAGNVIGGGDFSKDRILPDCLRAIQKRQEIMVRNPDSKRPYQHVLDPVFAYLMIAAIQAEDSSKSGYYNVGPEEDSCRTTGEIVSLFCEKWNEVNNEKIKWVNRADHGPHEDTILKLDSTKLKTAFGWNPRWNLEQAVQKTVEWNVAYLSGKDVSDCMDQQIVEYVK